MIWQLWQIVTSIHLHFTTSGLKSVKEKVIHLLKMATQTQEQVKAQVALAMKNIPGVQANRKRGTIIGAIAATGIYNNSFLWWMLELYFSYDKQFIHLFIDQDKNCLNSSDYMWWLINCYNIQTNLYHF